MHFGYYKATEEAGELAKKSNFAVRIFRFFFPENFYTEFKKGMAVGKEKAKRRRKK